MVKITTLFFIISISLIGQPTYDERNIYDKYDYNIDCSELENILPANVLDYSGTPDSTNDRSSLTFSDQGAWFAYGFPDTSKYYGGFSGPFLMTQENGIWCSPSLGNLTLIETEKREVINWKSFTVSHNSYNSHLEKTYQNDKLKIEQYLVFSSAHTAIIKTKITNLSSDKLILQPEWKGELFDNSLRLIDYNGFIQITSNKSNASGFIKIFGEMKKPAFINDSSYSIVLKKEILQQGEVQELYISQSFIFPEYNWELEQLRIVSFINDFNNNLQNRIKEKELEVIKTSFGLNPIYRDSTYTYLINKCILTLQNNWRAPAGELKHSGVFPSYHYIWFHGLWAWDSWKHSVALAKYNLQLAKEQIRAMFYFQKPDGFIPDCVYRDTTIENHNYRNTKPPLSAWAVWEIYNQDNDNTFLNELYPKIKRQHGWWYNNRDNDADSLCEYGSIDGTLIAAKWESGMDNAARFDNSKIIKNSDFAYSLNQESVDLNSYLYAEKILLAKMALVIGDDLSSAIFREDAEKLKIKIQSNFYDSSSGWFYDTSLDGQTFITEMGCEGWIPLWTNAATQDQAESVMRNIIFGENFNSLIPLQTLSASNKKFEPDGGYWRGPVWIDQSYFGVIGLKNYGFINEANDLTNKLLHNSAGVLVKGKSIRENYNPVTGAGLEAKNFSWSAAHFLLLLLED